MIDVSLLLIGLSAAWAADPVGPSAQQQQHGVQQAQNVADLTQDAMRMVAEGNANCFRSGYPNYAAAEASYIEARRLEPKNTYVLISQATCYLRRAKDQRYSVDNSVVNDDDRIRRANKWFDRAEGLAHIALEVNSSYSSAHLVIAQSQGLRGRPQDAVATLNNMERDNLIPDGRESAFYAWRAWSKKKSGSDYMQDLHKANELFDPIPFAEFTILMQDPLDKTVPRPAVAPWP